MSPVERLRSALSGLPGVEQVASRFGSRRHPAWVVSGREFAHLHSDDRLDLRLPQSVQATLRSDPRVRFRKSRSEWLELEFHSIEDVTHLEALARRAWAAAKRSGK
jgi:Luciferase